MICFICLQEGGELISTADPKLFTHKECYKIMADMVKDYNIYSEKTKEELK